MQSALEQVGLGEAVVNPILGMETPFAYRNKAQYAVRGSEAAPRSAYRKHSHDLITADDCAVQDSLHVELNARVPQLDARARHRGL